MPHFAGINTFLKAPYAENVRDVGRYDAAVMGVPFDGGTTYRPGTRFGPQGMRRISALYTPYNYELGVDYNGDGKVDLRHSTSDVLASTAKLLAHHGWRRGEPWLQEVRVPRELPWQEADVSIEHPRSQWAKWGVRLAGGKPLPADGLPASLLLPMGRNGPAFLGYRNFKVYTEWNKSLIYAITAAYYATRLAGAPPYSKGRRKVPAFGARQVAELQRLLTRRGYDAGEADGKLGLHTRAAVRKAQQSFGLPADSYPSDELFAHLRGR